MPGAPSRRSEGRKGSGPGKASVWGPGAEYAAQGLPPPRNDWMLSTRELARLPLWRDDPSLLERLDGLVTTRREGNFSPNAAPAAALQAWLGGAANGELITRMLTLREESGFVTGEVAQAATGLPLARDEFFFFTSDMLRLTIDTPGLRRALQYNLWLRADGLQAPWAILESRAASTRTPADSTPRAIPFPLVLSAARP